MNQQKLIELLSATINQKKQDMKTYSHKLDISLPEKAAMIDVLKKDMNEIITIDMNKLNAIIDSLELMEKQKTSLKNNLDIIKALLTLNKTQNTNYTLSEEQTQALNLFIESLEEYIKKQNTKQESLDPEYNEVITLTNKYKKLLMLLKNPNNKNLITDFDSIALLFQENKLSEEEKQVILLSLLKYNQEITNIVIKKYENTLSEEESLTEKELSKIFLQFGYTFTKLDSIYQQEIVKHGTVKNITEVFLVLQKEQFPKLDETTQGLIIAALVLTGTKKSVKESIHIAWQKGIRLEQLPTIIPALLDQESLIETNLPIRKASQDFKDNLSLLTERGISISNVVEECKELLIMEHTKLQYNLDVFEKYGFTIFNNTKNLMNAALSSLKAKNITETLDLFIETHPLGLSYVKDNLSALTMNPIDNELLFYKLYRSKNKEGASPFRLTISEGIKKLQLCGVITNPNLPYQGILDKKTALEITKAYQVPIKNKELLDAILLKEKQHIISDQIFDNPYIIALDRFSDVEETLIYDINGLRISKLKILRIYDILLKNEVEETLNSLLYAITYNTILTEEEYNKLTIDIKTTTGLKEV